MKTTEFLSDPDVRFAVVDKLCRLESAAEQAGNRAVQLGDYRVAVPNFILAAQYGRAANALNDRRAVDPRDRRQVEQACGNVKARMGNAGRVLAGIGGAR